MASYSDVLFGRIVLKNRLATQAQIHECLSSGVPGQTLGELLVDQGYLSPQKAAKVQRAQALMQFMRAERAFARIVVDKRLVDLQTLRKCFEWQAQNQHRSRLAQILVERRMISPEQCEAIVDEQLIVLADEFARIEEEGLVPSRRETARRKREVDELSSIHKIEDLDDSTMKRAVGPRGLIDNAPSRDAVRRTIPMMKAAKLDEEEAPKHTLIMPGSHSGDSSVPAPPSSHGGQDELVGKTIASRYRIMTKVGEGGMGTVYKAEHCLMEKIVALKVLHASLLSSKASLDRFRLEIRAASRFQHKNVIQIYDAGEGEGGLFYMAMEFAEGETLEEILDVRGALPTDVVLNMFQQTLAAVGEAHKKGIVHRDLKSGNLMIVADPKTGERLVKVMDFGIAKFAFDEEEQQAQGGLYRTQEGIVTGTPQDMSPEQASGEAVDYRSDLYSMGVILFEMLTGELPFKSNTPMGFLGKHIVEPPPRPGLIRPGVPLVLEEVTLKLLEKKPDDRYQSAENVLQDLAVRCSGEGLSVISTADTQLADRVPELAAYRAAQRAPAPAPPKPTPPPQRTLAVPKSLAPAAEPAASAGRKPIALVAGLLVLLLLVVTGSTTLVLVLKSSDNARADALQTTLKEARKLVDRGESDAAIQLLETIPEPTPEITKLLGEARKRAGEVEEAARLAENADRLAASFTSGEAGREAAEEALRQYELSLGLHDDPDVRARLDEARAALEAKTKPADQGKRGLSLILEATDALQDGRLEVAARALADAERLLPADHKALAKLKKHVRAERLLGEAAAARAAGDLPRAQPLLNQARELHPIAARRDQISADIQAVRDAIAQRERKNAIAGLLTTALRTGGALDMEAARAALEQAKKTASELKLDEPLIAQRERALEQLSAFADRLLSAADALERMETTPASAGSGEADELVQTFAQLKPSLDALNDDPPLQGAVRGRLEDWSARSAKLVERLASLSEDLKSRKLKRFERKLAMIREAEAKDAEAVVSKQSDLRRLNELLNLQEHPSYVHEECAQADRSWIVERVGFYTKRRKVWQDLKPDDADTAPEMVAIRGGRWTPPGGQETTLPETYYVAATEVTCVEWQRYMRATGAKRPTAFPGPRDEPVRFITLRDAKAYCRWRSKRSDGSKRRVEFRLPTEVEWERAARGPKGTRFPWGDSFEGNRDRYAAISGRLSRVGAFPKDENGWGLKDIVGNVSEITTAAGDPRRVVLRGGSAISERANTGADFRKEVRPGDEASGYAGLRLLAVER